MTASLHAFADSLDGARRLAAALGLGCHTVALRHFPDGESLVRVEPAPGTAILYRALADPNARLVELLLAAAALRDGGAERVVLVAPYLPYMRQDRAFVPGEAVSQRVVGALLADAFDAVVTVDPHLHRTPDLGQVLPGCTAVAVSAAPALAAGLANMVAPDTLLIGPDAESRPWAAAVAGALGLELLVADKQRGGDRAVTLALPDAGRARGRPVLLVDDLLSSGGTLLAATALVKAAGARSVAAAVTHCLAGAGDLARLADAGIAPLLAGDGVPGPIATIALAPVIAQALRQHRLC